MPFYDYKKHVDIAILDFSIAFDTVLDYKLHKTIKLWNMRKHLAMDVIIPKVAPDKHRGERRALKKREYKTNLCMACT